MKTVKRGRCFNCGKDYGVRLELSDGSVFTLHHVDCTKASVDRLIERVRGEELDREQLQYVVEDHLTREYTLKR